MTWPRLCGTTSNCNAHGNRGEPGSKRGFSRPPDMVQLASCPIALVLHGQALHSSCAGKHPLTGQLCVTAAPTCPNSFFSLTQALVTAGATGVLLAEQLDDLLTTLLSWPEGVQHGTPVDPKPQLDTLPASAAIS